MTGDFPHRASAACWWLYLASRIVPRDGRAAWRSRQERNLHNFRILEERGELPGQNAALLACVCRDAAAGALFLRWGAFDPWKWVRGPAFAIAAAWAALLLLAACTQGFAGTRSLVHALRAGAHSDRLIANSVPIVFAVITGAIAAVQRAFLPRHGWTSLGFLAFKTLSLAAIPVALWIEGGPALRAAIPNELLRALGGGLGLAIAFIAVFHQTVVWSLADQQHRCPDCLRRLVRPVRIGTWASIFEPVTTEWICEAGHGSLCVDEIQAGRSNQWIQLTPEPAPVTSGPVHAG
jgi:hypothetical protein